MEINRSDLVRILGEETVQQAESMPDDKFQQQKWDRYSELIYSYEKLCHLNLFEARRSFLLGLDRQLQRLLIRHIIDIQKNEFDL